jgi:hypothetical protein
MSEAKIEAYIFYSNGEICRETSSAGMIYGVHYGQIESILDEVLDNFGDWFSNYIGDNYDEFLSGDGLIDFEIKNISWDEGQQSFPEEGLWDYLPHWDLEIVLKSNEKFPDNAEMIEGDKFTYEFGEDSPF